MKVLLKFGLIALVCATAGTAVTAQDETALSRWEADHLTIFDASEISLEDFKWIARPVVVFADSPNDPNFIQQLEMLLVDLPALAERDVIVITDTDPDARTETRLQLRPRGFMLALLGKDGNVAMRKPTPWGLREIARSIDKMPLRQQEIEDRRLLAQ